jgi:uncharacterized membrane protein YfcA
MPGLPPLLGAAVVLHEHVGALTALGLAGLGLFAGWLGAVVGIGGGVVIVPALVLAFGFDMKVAVSSSLVAVVATSAAAGSAYASSGQLNMRLALTLEMATTVGGLVGGVVAALIAGSLLDGLFAVVMLSTATLVFRGRDEHGALPVRAAADAPLAVHAPEGGVRAPAAPSPAARPVGAGATTPGARRALEALGDRVGWEERGHLAGAYHDQVLGTVVIYRAVRLWIGWAVSFGAGLLSGLLGLGGGFLKVPAMHLGMKVPIKVAAATSNFMIGVTAVASLFVYFARGYVLPFVAAPIALGIALGAYAGAKSSQRVSSRVLGRILAVVLVFVAVEMGLKALGVTGV